MFIAFCFRMANMKEMMMELEEIRKVQTAALEAARVQEVKQQGRSDFISRRREGYYFLNGLFQYLCMTNRL